MNLDKLILEIPQMNEDELFATTHRIRDTIEQYTDEKLLPVLRLINERLDKIAKRRELLFKYLR